MKIHLDLISATDGSLLGVVKVNEMLYRQAQQEISCYGITLFQYLNLWFQELQTFPPKVRTHYLSTLAANSRMQSDTCFWFGSGQHDPILACFYDWGKPEL